MSDTPISFAITSETREALELLADLHDVPAEAVAAQLLVAAVKHESDEFRAFVQEGVDAAGRGELISQDEVFAAIRAKRKTLKAA